MPERNHVRIGLLGASLETGNLGVNALASGAITCLLHRWPSADIFLLDYAKQENISAIQVGGRQVFIRLVNIRFSKSLFLANNIVVLLAIAAIVRLVPGRRSKTWVARQNARIHEIWQATFLASIAGGDSFSDIYGLRRFVYVFLPQLLVVILGKKLVLLPQTYGPFRRKSCRTLAAYIMRRAERIYARDYDSLDTAVSMCSQGRCDGSPQFAYDVAFTLQPSRPTRFAKGSMPIRSSRVGINVSGLLFRGGYDGRNMFGLMVNYRHLVFQVIELMIQHKNASVLLIPHVLGNKAGSESDWLACREVYSEARAIYGDRIDLVESDLNEAQIKYVIGQCDFFVGSRMHACIAALSQCVPAVCVAYSDKFIGVMGTISAQELVADARKLDEPELLSQIVEVYDRRESIRRELARDMPAVIDAALNLFNDLSLCALSQPDRLIKVGN